MNIDNTIIKYFEHKPMVKIFTEYVLYYQISLGNLAFETIGDSELTVKKLKELNLSLQPDDILARLFETIEYISSEDQLTETLKLKAMVNALTDFVTNDNDLLNKERFIEMKGKAINENLFFNSQMKMQYLKEYHPMQQYYEDLITEEFLSSIKEGISK